MRHSVVQGRASKVTKKGRVQSPRRDRTEKKTRWGFPKKKETKHNTHKKNEETKEKRAVVGSNFAEAGGGK